MEKIVRHFVASRLGRGVIEASFTADGSASIDLVFDPSQTEQQHIRLNVTPSCAGILPFSGVELLFQLSRHAISHVQNHVREKTLDGSDLELTCLFKPWNGDLTDLPYGGATKGCTESRAIGDPAKIQRIARHYLDCQPRIQSTTDGPISFTTLPFH